MKISERPTGRLSPRRVSDWTPQDLAVQTGMQSAHAPLSPEEATAQIEFVRLFALVWRRKGFVLSIIVGCCALALAVGALQPEKYRSHLTMELLGVNQNFMDLRELDPNGPTSTSNSPDTYVQTEIELLRNDSLVRSVLEKLPLPKEKESQSLGFLGQFFSYGDKQSRAFRDLTLATATALSNLRVTQVRESILLDASFDNRNPRYAADFLNMLASEAIQRNIDDRWNTSQRVGSWLNKQTELLRQKMEHAETELQQYSKSSGLLYTADKDNIAETRLTQLEEELARAQGDRIQKQSRFELAEKADPDALPEILDSSPLRQYQVKLSELTGQKAQLLATLTPQNPQVLKVQAQIEEVAKTITQQRKNVIDGVANDFRTARGREAMLQAVYAAQSGIVSDQSAKAIHYNTLKREVETSRALYETMLRRVSDAEVVSAMRASDLRVVNPAVPPAIPHSPNRPLTAAIGLLSGLCIAFTAVFIGEQRNHTIQIRGYASRLFSVPELGVIPHTPRGIERERAGQRRAPGLFITDSRAKAPAAIVKPADRLLADSFVGIANSLLFRKVTDPFRRVVLVTSAWEKEGKTFTVWSLGVSFAEIGLRVLLVDADFGKPRLHEMCDIPNDRGLLNTLASSADSKTVSTLVKPTSVAGLSILPAGHCDIPTATLLHSPLLATVLDELRRDYDLVLLDSAPLLLVPYSRLLARAADARILIVRAGVTTTDQATGVRDQLAQDGTPLLGVILNAYKPESKGYVYYAS